MDLPIIAILGAGSMGGAILSGLLSPSVQLAGPVRVTNRSASKASAISNASVESLATELNPDANIQAVTSADIVILAVKPAMIPELLTEIASHLSPGTLVVSVAAGVTTSRMEQLLPETVSVFRAMPNTPAHIGKGVTGLSAGSRTSKTQLEQVQTLFETVGKVVVIPEEQIDALSTISGSGPAYVYYFIEQFTKAAIDLGFNESTALLLVSETFLGASELLAMSGQSPTELRRQVTSPKGTTEKAIEQFEAANLKAVFDKATAAALARAKELAAQV